MEYNSSRPDMAIPEYGRNIHNMVRLAIELTDRTERNKAASAIIHVMSRLVPQLKDLEDYKQKLWDHLHIMAGFNLDVDSPYPKPDPTILKKRPDKVPYPGNSIKYDHYGRHLEEFVKRLADSVDYEDKDKAALRLANLMKANYVNYNQSHVEDKLILRQLSELSKGRLNPIASDGLSTPVEHVKQMLFDKNHKKKNRKKNR